MTTILVDAKLGLMVSDSSISDGDRLWLGRKVWRVKGALIGFSGSCDEAVNFLAWWRLGGKAPKFDHSQALVLQGGKLTHYERSNIPQPVASGIEAIGSGAKAARCAYEALGHNDPALAVRIVCKHDSNSRGPIRVYKAKT